MKRPLVTLCVLALALLAFVAVGCSAEPAAVELTQADSGSVQLLSVGQQLRISLEANPTTGYQWAVDGTVPDALEQAGEPEYSAESDAIGAGGTETWTFTGARTGAGTLKLKYWRSFEPTVAPIETFSVEVSVR